MKPLRILAASWLVAAAACDDTSPDDPLGLYAYADPVHDLLPLFAQWDESWACTEVPEPVEPGVLSSCGTALALRVGDRVSPR